jgi:hypothetical protein
MAKAQAIGGCREHVALRKHEKERQYCFIGGIFGGIERLYISKVPLIRGSWRMI